MVRTGLLHQMIGRRPVAMAVEQRPYDPAIQHAGERFVFRLRPPFRDDFTIYGKTADPQSVTIRRTATPACVFGSVFFLKRLLRHFSPSRTGVQLNLTSHDLFGVSASCKACACDSFDCRRAALSR